MGIVIKNRLIKKCIKKVNNSHKIIIDDVNKI